MMETAIKSCSTSACAFNHNGCTAFAVTIGGSDAKPTCRTFIELDARGGLSSANGKVGACQRLECTHNKDLMCTASSIEVGGSQADCLAYQAK
ncbi:DUF1540 domain-containing protein [Propionibacterium freudenreichii]|nr:DUF1540 domain-containing protein [Propionibacterium freudenreichii]MDK9296541.1 DUF1540 domain-containing protein [Propionibacterium freudenreichii]MDK9320356.1 DUF1540 domain-containing protein [Propionibacterium freudenreichii]MDK9339730.1 DUF1540 domain-containing protein [Propionibacterium freudenreichii]MDK9342512.1 DUF1540 domain-containing protein [Propionibacterium freudenreichii]